MYEDIPVSILTARFEHVHSRLNHFGSLLNAVERSRAEKFRFERDRIMFVLSRAILRSLLARYLDKDAASVKLVETRHGKPFIESNPIYFNVSHSHGMVVFGFTKTGEIGVDVEWSRREVEVEEISKRFFSKSEYASLMQLPPGERRSAFFNIWTRKEAFIKAVGEGLSFPLDQFEVSIGEEARLLRTHWDKDAVNKWTMKEISLPNDFVGAVAVRGNPEDISVSPIDPAEILK